MFFGREFQPTFNVCGGHTRLKIPVSKWSSMAPGKRNRSGHVRNFLELGFMVGPLFVGYKRLFSTPIQVGHFVRFKPKFKILVENKTVLL